MFTIFFIVFFIVKIVGDSTQSSNSLTTYRPYHKQDDIIKLLVNEEWLYQKQDDSIKFLFWKSKHKDTVSISTVIMNSDSTSTWTSDGCGWAIENGAFLFYDDKNEIKYRYHIIEMTTEYLLLRSEDGIVMKFKKLERMSRKNEQE